MIECVLNNRDPSSHPVSGENAEKVYRLLMEYILPETSRMYNEVLVSEDRMGDARWIAGYILSRGAEKISSFDIRRAYSALERDPHALHQATQTLELMGWITPDQKRFGREDIAKQKWRVNPQVHVKFKARAEAEHDRRKAEKAKIAEAVRKLQARKSR